MQTNFFFVILIIACLKLTDQTILQILFLSFINFTTMQVRFFLHFLLITFFILIFSQVADAQRIEENKEGEKIVMFPEGKWEYFDKTNPTHLAIEKELKSSKIASPTKILDQQTSKGENDEHLQYDNLLDKTEEKLLSAKERESDIRFSKLLLEEEMEELKNNETATDDQYNSLKRQLKLVSALENDAKKKTKKIKKELKKLKKKGKIVQKSSRKKSKKKNSRKSRKQREKEIELQDSKYTYREDGNFYIASKKFEKYSLEKDVMYNPPPKDCNLAFDGIDEFMGRNRKDVERDVLFSFTDDDMRRYMKEEDYIICEGNLTQIKGGILLLNLFISIKTLDAQRSFGGLSKGNLVTIKMIDGKSVSLVNNQSDNGVYNPLEKRHTFTGQFRINAGQEKDLNQGEVDMVRIIWDTGYEDYEVYNLDFFIDQFKCLNN